MIEHRAILGAVLAGGRSRRMLGADKALLDLGGAALLARAASRLQSQVDTVVVNSNRPAQELGPLAWPLVADRVGGFSGPLAGVHACMEWARDTGGDHTHLVSIAADTPFFPETLVASLVDAAPGDDAIVLAASGGHRHPVFGLWPIGLAADLAGFLASGESFKVMHFVARHPYATAEFPFLPGPEKARDPFFNINTPHDLEVARSWMEKHGD